MLKNWIVFLLLFGTFTCCYAEPEVAFYPGQNSCMPYGPQANPNSYSQRSSQQPPNPYQPHMQPQPPIGQYPDGQGLYTFNYEGITVTELVRFISQITHKNFIFNCGELDFCINVVSEQPTTIDDMMTALLQVLRVHGLNMTQEGNNIIIFRQDIPISRVSPIVTDDNARFSNAAVVTRVFRVYNIMLDRLAQIIRPLLSPNAVVEVSVETRHLIITDLSANVDKIAELLQTLDTPNAAIDVGQYVVKSAYPQSLIGIAFQILRPIAQDSPLNMVVQPSSGTIFIIAPPYLIHRAMEVLASLDTESVTPDLADLPPQDFANTNFYVYKLRYHQGEEIAQALRDIGANLQRTGLANMDLVSAIQSMQWIVANNTLVFSGTDASIEKIRKLLGDLDRAPKQVFIEVLILDTSLLNSLDFGVEWIGLGNEQNKAAIGFGSLSGLDPNSDAFVAGARSALNCPPPNAARPGGLGNLCSTCPGASGCGDVPLGSGFTLGVIGDIITHNGQSFFTLGALLHAVEQEGNSKVILNPRIMTEDTKEANVFVGQNIPYQTTNVVQKDTGTVTQNIQYEDIGIQLRVTPYVSTNNVVTLDIDQSISDVSNLVPPICSGSGTAVIPATLTPITNKTLTQTRVHVPDRAFLVLSGIIRDEITNCWEGIPCLGSLPCIGPLFGTQTETRQKRSLILFIRPFIIDTLQEGIDLTNQQGTQYNWDANPCSTLECGPLQAPECEEIINIHNHPPER